MLTTTLVRVPRAGRVGPDFRPVKGAAPSARSPRCPAAPLLATLAASLLAAMPAAHAGTWDLGGGVEAVWSLSASVTGGWRMTDPDPNLIGPGDGGQASAGTHSHDKNFQKGDNISKLARIVGDINLRKGQSGLVLRAKAWDNFLYANDRQPFGAPSNDYHPNTRLSDREFDTRLSKFKGVELFDAYGYTAFDIGESSQLTVRLGQHIVNFGESLFVPGVNQYQALDVTALRQPGTQLKEALLPVPQLSANLGLGNGFSVEAFYQFRWRRTAIDGCGTYWSPANALNCVNGSILVGGDGTSEENWNGYPHAAFGGLVANYQFSRLVDKEPANSGQFGLAVKKMVEPWDTEFGLYYVNYTAKVPNLSAIRRVAGLEDSIQHPAGSVYALNPLTRDASIYWDYSANNIKVAGLTATTVLGGWSVGAELTHTRDFPVQINSVDAFYALAAGIGPMATIWGPGPRTMIGYERKNKTQLQASAFRLLPAVLGATGGSVVGEIAFQRWSGIGDPSTGVRYGRGFEYGAAAHQAYGGACLAAATNLKNCTTDGYFTSDAAGVRLLVELEYPQWIPNAVVKPRLFYSRDFQGWSADGVFSKGRQAVSPGVKFDINKRYTIDLSYSRFNHNAHFDSFHDRDFLALVVAANF
ncbi:Protein of unknown function [Roseateles sp. YR242]|nr:Protein of unknown function [Roseateles sp. YR242]